MLAPARILPACEVLDLYVRHLRAGSYCVDLSTAPVRLLHAESGTALSTEALDLQFPAWASGARLRVLADEYCAFRGSLRQRVMERLPHVAGYGFKPVDARFFKDRGMLVANVFRPYAPDRPADMTVPAIWDEYLSARLCPVEEDRAHVVRFFSHLVQHPEQRPQHGLLIRGSQGSGKSSIVEAVKLALGGRWCWHEGNYSPLSGGFSEELSSNLLVAFDDAVPTSNTYERLKHAMTSSTQAVNKKFVQGSVPSAVYSRIVVLSNKDQPLPGMAFDDRRFYVTERCEHMVSQEESAKFYVGLHRWLEQPGTAAFLHHWFMDQSLDGFLVGSTKKTEAHRKMLEGGRSMLDHHVRMYVEDKPIFHQVQLMTFLKAHGISAPRADDVKEALEAEGYQAVRRVVAEAAGGKQIPLWSPAGAKRGRSLTEDEQEAIRLAVGDTF